MTIKITDEMQQAFLFAKSAAAHDGNTGTSYIYGLAAVLAIIERDYLAVMADLVDPDECWFDHHGGCQAHSYLSLEPGELCPNERAKLLLGTSVDS